MSEEVEEDMTLLPADSLESYYNFTLGTNQSTVFNRTVLDPADLIERSLTVILVYCALFVVAAIGNLAVFFSLFRSRHRKSRISLMIKHLTIADLIVTFVMIPIEVGWRLTGRWIAGNVACKILLFMRAFGPYLSSNVLVCVSLDRYFAVLHPLKVNEARRRGKVMLAFAWGASITYCIPQTFIFQVQTHPDNPKLEQCVSFGALDEIQEVAYNVMCLMFMYFIPLFAIIIAYTAIVWEISKNSKDNKGETYSSSKGRIRLRRSDISKIERARGRTLRMTITIVAVYVWCCTPYAIITLWYMFDRSGAANLPKWLQEMFFMMVVSNSCMNPIVYGSYALNLSKLNCKICCKKTSAESITNDGGNLAAGYGRSKGLARRLIKCFLSNQKGASPMTRSTLMRQDNNQISISPLTDMKIIQEAVRTQIRAPSIGHISFEDRSRGQQLNFYSEPCSSSLSNHELLPLSVEYESYATSEPDLSPKPNIKLKVDSRDFKRVRVRTRYI